MFFASDPTNPNEDLILSNEQILCEIGMNDIKNDVSLMKDTVPLMKNSENPIHNNVKIGTHK